MLTRYIEDSAAFEPETLQAMSNAFSETCNALRVFAGDEHGREVIAVRIIELARSGMIDADALRDRLLREARTDA